MYILFIIPKSMSKVRKVRIIYSDFLYRKELAHSADEEAVDEHGFSVEVAVVQH